MSKELSAAAEPVNARLLAAAEMLVCLIEEVVHQTGMKDGAQTDRVFAWYEFDDLRAAIAAAKAQQADDDTPVDEAWLRSLGFDSNGRLTFGRLQFTYLGGWNSWWSFSDGRAATRMVDDVKTRGHVRRLAAALGVTLSVEKISIRGDDAMKPDTQAALKRLAQRDAEFKIDQWMPHEDCIARYYYPRLHEWIQGGMQKPANTAFTSGLGRVMAELCEEAVRRQQRR